jgi:phage tail-like protein
MANIDFKDGYRVHEFVVEIEGSEGPNITKVNGLTAGQVEAIEQPHGGANITRKITSGIIKHGDLTLERNLDGSKADADFETWFQEMFAVDGTGTGSKIGRKGSIVVKEDQEEVMRFVFEGAWIKSSKFSDLDAASSGLLKQTIVLTVERMYRV